MRRLLFTIVACLFLTGCAIDTSKIPFIGSKSSDDSNSEYPIEYDEEGNVIPVEVTDPETGETYLIDPVLGFRIDTSIDEELPNGDGMFTESVDVSVSDLLGQRTSYPQLTITLYGLDGNPRIVDQYLYDDFNNTAVRYEYNSYNSLSMTYFDNKTNKAYTNLGMRGWQELSNERLESLQVMLNADGFEEEELYKSGDFLYLKGVMPLRSLGNGRDIISRMIINNFKSLSDIKLEGMYSASDNSLLRLEMRITNEAGEYLLAVVPNDTRQTVVVPDNVLHKEQVIDKEVVTDMERIPAFAYIKKVIYGDAEDITREVILSTYGFKRTDIIAKYGDNLDINSYLERLGTMIEDDMSILDFVKNVNDGVYSGDVDKAVSDTIYDKMLKLDQEMSDEDIAALELKPEPVEYPIEYDENGNVILIEETDDEGNTIWINPETGLQVNEDGSPLESEEGDEEEGGETVEEPDPETEEKIMYATTTVNVRRGPGTGFDKVGSVVQGTPVTVTSVDESDPTWFHVRLMDGTEGCIKSDYLKE